ncbi:jg15122 [Pararge aegeria aegeria]|uniref:Translation initiation factor eIF2B subunit gamma n=1 Tax=Pararge aegeria aegeria TaxID=348720 RepID=A0A8S4RH73_9NEOP|nr:jg15122 [Pararge aegeria aegeria]
MSDSSIMSVREMIDNCFGEPDVNIVNFKLMQTILYLLARQQRLLERRVAIEFGASLVPRTSSLSITEVKLKANVYKKTKKYTGESGVASSKSKGKKTKADKTSIVSTTDEVSTSKSTSEKTTTDKSSSLSTTDNTTASKSTLEKLTTDKMSSKTTTDKTTTSKSYKSITAKTTFKTSADTTTLLKSTEPSISDKTTIKTAIDTTKTEKSMPDNKSSKSTGDKPATSELSSFTKHSTLSSFEKSKSLSDKTKISTGIFLSAKESSDKAKSGKTKKTRADSREVAEKTPTPMASLDSMEVQYEKLLVVERVPVEEAEKKIGRLRDGKMTELNIVTQKDFDELAHIVKEMQTKFGLVGEAQENMQLMQDVQRSSSMTDAMAALQISARIENLEKALKLMDSMITNLAIKTDIKIKQQPEGKINTFPVQQIKRGGDTPETKVIYDAPRDSSYISGKSGRETEDMYELSKPPLIETEDPVMELLKGLPKTNNINMAELDDATQELYDDLIQTVGNLTNKAISKADDALKTACKLEAKLDTAIDVDTRMENLEMFVSEYTGKINRLDANLSSQMSNYQEQLTQMQHDLEGGLEAMAEALANPPTETPGVEELNANFTNLQIQFDIANMRQKDLQESQGVLSLDVQSLWKEIELLREVKSDRDEVADALRDKAGLGQLNGLVTHQQFDAVRGDFEKRIGASYDKFNNQEIIWQKIIDDLLRELNEKADWVQLAALRDNINDNLEKLQNKIHAMEEIIGEPHAATISRRLFRDAACLSCSTPAHMNLEEATLPALPAFTKTSRPITIGAEDTTKPKEDGDHGLCYPGQPIPHAKDPRSHFFRRYCGGSHTAIRGKLSRAPAEIIVSTLRGETTGVGSDGKKALIKSKCSQLQMHKILEFQAVVLAAGRGSRLPDVGGTVSKCLLPVGPYPVLWYSLNLLEKYGFQETMVVVLDEDKSNILNALEKCPLKIKYELIVIPSDEDWGTANSLKHLSSRVTTDLIVVSGDLITNVNLNEVLNLYRKHDAALTTLFFNNGPEEWIELPGLKSKAKPDRDLVCIDKETERLVFLASASDFEENITIPRMLMKKFRTITMYSRLLDAHVYVMKNWVISYLVECDKYTSIKGELIPHIVKKQLSKPKNPSEKKGTSVLNSNVGAHVAKSSVINLLKGKRAVTYSLDRYGEIVDPDNCGRMFSTCYQPPKVEKTRA